MPVLPDGTRLPYTNQTQNQTQNQTVRQRNTTGGTPSFADFARTQAGNNDLGGVISALARGLTGNAFNRPFDHPIFRATNLPALTPNPQEPFGQFLQRYLQQLGAGLSGRGMGGAVSAAAPPPVVPATPGAQPTPSAPTVPAGPTVPAAPIPVSTPLPATPPAVDLLRLLVQRGGPDRMVR